MSRFMQRSEEPTVEVIVGVTGQDAMIGRSQRGAKGMLGDIESTSIEVETDCLSDPTTQLLLAFDREVFGHPFSRWLFRRLKESLHSSTKGLLSSENTVSI